MAELKVGPVKRRKRFFVYIMDELGLTAREVAEKVKRPAGETVDKWKGKVGSIRCMTIEATVNEDNAPYFAPALGVDVEVLLDPPSDSEEWAKYLKPSANGTASTTAPMSMDALQKARGVALDAFMKDYRDKDHVDRGLSAPEMAKKTAENPDDEDEVGELSVMYGEARNGEELLSAMRLHHIAQVFDAEVATLVIQYTPDEMAELDIKEQLPMPGAAAPAAPPAKAEKPSGKKAGKGLKFATREASATPAPAAVVDAPVDTAKAPKTHGPDLSKATTTVATAVSFGHPEVIKAIVMEAIQPSVTMEGDAIMIDAPAVHISISAADYIRRHLPPS